MTAPQTNPAWRVHAILEAAANGDILNSVNIEGVQRLGVGIFQVTLAQDLSPARDFMDVGVTRANAAAANIGDAQRFTGGAGGIPAESDSIRIIGTINGDFGGALDMPFLMVLFDLGLA